MSYPTTDCPTVTGSGEDGAGGCCLRSPASCRLICHAPPVFLCCLLLSHLAPACCCCCLVAKSRPVLCNSMGCSLPAHRVAKHCWWDFPGKNTGLSCHFLLQEIFLTQGSNPHLLHWQVDSLPPSHLESPYNHNTKIKFRKFNIETILLPNIQNVSL